MNTARAAAHRPWMFNAPMAVTVRTRVGAPQPNYHSADRRFIVLLWDEIRRSRRWVSLGYDSEGETACPVVVVVRDGYGG